MSSTETVKKNPLKVQAMIAGLYRTMIYIHNPVNRGEVIQYIARYHGIDLGLAEKAFTAQMLSYSKDGTKPRKAVEREIEIYREILKMTKTFTPDDLEDMSLLRKVKREQLPKGDDLDHAGPNLCAGPTDGSSGIRWDLPMQHGEDEFPVPRCCPFVVDIAIGQRVAVLRTWMHGESITYATRLQYFVQFLNHRQRRMGIVLGEATIKFPA